MRPQARAAPILVASTILVTACAGTEPDSAPADEPTTAESPEGMVPVANDNGERVGWIDQQALDHATQAQAEGRPYEPVPVVDEDGQVVGHFEPGPH